MTKLLGLILMIGSIALGAEVPGTLPETNRVISSGFESAVSFSNGRLRGIDHSLSNPHNDWDSLRDLRFRTLIQETGRIAIVNDPVNDGNKVLMCEVLTPNDKKGRAQGSFNFLRPESYDTYLCRYRWFIPAQWESIRELNPHGWNDFFEIWTQTLPKSECDVYDPAGSFRLNFRFEQSPNSNRFRWHLKGENRSYNRRTGSARWQRTNDTVLVPFGRWATVEVLVRKGPDPKTNPQSRARFTLRIQPDGEDWQTVFDVHVERTEHSARAQRGYLRLQPFKNYTQKKNVEFLVRQGKRVTFYYDDLDLRVR